MGDKKIALTKDDANKALDNINMWINSCDTKSSIVLGFYATIITICLSTDFVDVQSKIVTYLFDNISFLVILYIIVHFGAILSFIIGIIELLKVIVPRIILKTTSGEQFNSLLFYGSIAKNTPTYEQYCKKIKKIDEEDIINDLLFQVHSAAMICDKKFHYQKIGLVLTTISVLVFGVTTVIGILIV